VPLKKFSLTAVELGLDEDDEAITSCTVEYGQPGGAEARQRKPSASQVIALRALSAALISEGGKPLSICGWGVIRKMKLLVR